MGTNIIIGKTESLEVEFEPEPLSRNPITKKISKTTTPINNKSILIRIRRVLSKFNQPTNSNKNKLLRYLFSFNTSSTCQYIKRLVMEYVS